MHNTADPEYLFVFSTKINGPYTKRIKFKPVSGEFVRNINEITQIYSKEKIFYRDVKPHISNHFPTGEHLVLEYNTNFCVQELQSESFV